MRNSPDNELLTRLRRALRALPVLLAFLFCTLGADLSATHAEAPRAPAFQEIWAYFMRGDEKELTGKEPITALCYFGASLNTAGRIPEDIARPVIRWTASRSRGCTSWSPSSPTSP